MRFFPRPRTSVSLAQAFMPGFRRKMNYLPLKGLKPRQKEMVDVIPGVNAWAT
jgi:hypothetical protein